MKKNFLIILCVIIVVCVSIFGIKSYQNSKSNTPESFIKSFYTISDIENFDIDSFQLEYPNSSITKKLKKFTTSEAFDELVNSRVQSVFISSSNHAQLNCTVEKITLTKSTGDNDNHTNNYSVDLSFKKGNSTQIKESINVQLTISNNTITKINYLPIPKTIKAS